MFETNVRVKPNKAAAFEAIESEDLALLMRVIDG
jgi:hypothetical protein